MPLLGAHISIAGGISKAPLRGAELGCDAIQLFVKNNLQWTGPAFSESEIAKFKTNLQQTHIKIAFAHACYLINIATPDEMIYKKSCNCLLQEYICCEMLGLKYIIVHPGSHHGAGEKFGLRRVAQALNWIFAHRLPKNVKILLESTSGQGDNIGYCFSHLREILNSINYPIGVGICLDTCHLFSAGYDLRTAAKYEQTLTDFDNTVGLKHLYVIHLNDSKYPLGSRRDRHEHIGNGKLGIEPFRYLLNDSKLQHLPMIIETPKEQGNKMDLRNLNLLRSLLNSHKKKVSKN